MKIHLYKVLYIDNDTSDLYTNMVNCMVMNEQDLRNEFLWTLNEHIIPTEMLMDYQKDPDYAKENWNDLGNLSAGTMIDMMNDLVNYDCDNYYIITETDIEIGE